MDFEHTVFIKLGFGILAIITNRRHTKQVIGILVLSEVGIFEGPLEPLVLLECWLCILYMINIIK